MQDFDYVSALSVHEVVNLLAHSGGMARILSGGTDLLSQLREGRKTAGCVIDIKRIPEVNTLAYDQDSGLTIGAAIPCCRITGDVEIAARYPGLLDAVGLIGGVQIQGRASVGGNLCNASPAADSIPALIAYEAVCSIAGPAGLRHLPVEQFCIAPGRNALEDGEFLLSLRVPVPKENAGGRYLRFIPRNEMDIAVVGVGAVVVLSADLRKFVSARLALGAVAPTPLFVPEVGDFLAGKDVTPETIFEAARIAQSAARPISDMRGTAAQRTHLAMILARRALSGAVERAAATNHHGHYPLLKARR